MILFLLIVLVQSVTGSLDSCNYLNKTCITKCCKKGYAYVDENNNCTKENKDFKLDIIIFDGVNVVNNSSFDTDKFHIEYGVHCKTIIEFPEEINNYLQKNGTLYHPDLPLPSGDTVRFTSNKNEYCLEMKDGKIVKFICLEIEQKYDKIEVIGDKFKIIYEELSTARTNRLLIILSEYYSRLQEAVENLNDIFSIPLVVYILEIFTKNLVVLFNGVKYFLNANCEAIPEMIYASLVWSLIITLILFGVLTASVVLCENANMIGNQVHELVRKNNVMLSMERLKYFSMQLVHCKVEFNVCGMFPLDYTVLYTLIGASTTYLIIMIQIDSTKCE